MKSILLLIICFVFFIVACTGSSEENEYALNVAKCLSEKNVVMYSQFTCSHCRSQKKMFGDAFNEIEEVECNPNGVNPQTDRCLSMKIEATPTWIQEKDGKEIKRYAGSHEIDDLNNYFGCNIEKPIDES